MNSIKLTSFTAISHTYVENWPSALCLLSIPQIDIPLSLEEAEIIGRKIHQYSHWFQGSSNGNLEKIIQSLDAAIRTFPDGAFVRLGSRSAKDSYYALNRGLRVTDSQAAIKMLTGASRRVAFDLREALHHHYQPHIFIRKWIDIPKWAEFRCFMKNRKLIGVSQYDCKNIKYSPEIAKNASHIKVAIDTFFKKNQFKFHLDDVVFDVFVEIKQNCADISVKVTLLELNPFILITDPCLFDWSVKGDFDGTFRYLNQFNQIQCQ